MKAPIAVLLTLLAGCAVANEEGSAGDPLRDGSRPQRRSQFTGSVPRLESPRLIRIAESTSWDAFKREYETRESRLPEVDFSRDMVVAYLERVAFLNLVEVRETETVIRVVVHGHDAQVGSTFVPGSSDASRSDSIDDGLERRTRYVLAVLPRAGKAVEAIHQDRDLVSQNVIGYRLAQRLEKLSR